MVGYTSVSDGTYVYRNTAYQFDADLTNLYGLETEGMAYAEHVHQLDTYGTCQVCGEKGTLASGIVLNVTGLDDDPEVGEVRTAHWYLSGDTDQVIGIDLVVEYADDYGLHQYSLSSLTAEEWAAGEGCLQLEIPAAIRCWITALISWDIDQNIETVAIRSEDSFHGHDWLHPVYIRSENNAAVTAERTCGLDPEHVETEIAEVIRHLILAPTDTDTGRSVSVASFVNPIFEEQAEEEDIPCLNDLDALRLPAMLTDIEAEAFAGLACEAVIIPDGCTTIGSRAFANCGKLIYVRIPASVTSYPNDAFQGCGNILIDYRSAAVSR